jgi:hypothetical protein
MYADTIQQIAKTLTALEQLRLLISAEFDSPTTNSEAIDLVDINADIRQLSQTLIRIGGVEVTEKLSWLPADTAYLGSNTF